MRKYQGDHQSRLEAGVRLDSLTSNFAKNEALIRQVVTPAARLGETGLSHG